MISTTMISLIVPYYKNIDTIDTALASLDFALQQCASLVVEVVFVNNNSDDGTEAKVKNFIFANGCVVHITEREQGVSNARNTGIAASSGEYIAFLDADDAIEADYFSDVALGLKHGPDILFLRHDAFDEAQTYSSLPARLILQNHMKGWWNCQFVFKKTLVDDLKFQGACFEDFGFFPFILARARNCMVLGRGLYHYNDNPASVTKCSINWRISELEEQFDRLRFSANELGTDIYKRVQRDFYEHLSLLRAIAGRFPVLGMAESLDLLRHSHSWCGRREIAQRLLRLNLSTIYRYVKNLMK